MRRALAAVTANLLRMNTAAETGDEVKTAAPPAHLTQTIETAEPVIAETNEPERDMGVWETAAEHIAKTIYGEALVCSATERAAVARCILNRADDAQDTTPAGVIAVVTKPHRFHGYAEDNPLLPELKALALDVIGRWLDEKGGETDTGRVLPREYLFFSGDGQHNHFRTEWNGGQVWDWSLQSPYEE